MKRSPYMLVVVAVAMAALVSSVALASPTRGPDSHGIATERIDGAGLNLETSVPFERAVLTVRGPNGAKIEKSFGSGETISLGLEVDGKALADGSYRYSLRMSPRSATGSRMSGLFFVENGSAVSRDTKRVELAGVRADLNQARVDRQTQIQKSKAQATKVPLNAEAAPGPENIYVYGGVNIHNQYGTPWVTFSDYDGPAAGIYANYEQGLWATTWFGIKDDPTGYYYSNRDITLDSSDDIYMYSNYDIRMYSDDDIWMNAWDEIGIWANWGMYLGSYYWLDLDSNWVDIEGRYGVYTSAYDGNIVNRASNRNGKCCPNRSTSPMGREFYGDGNIVLLAEYDSGPYYDRGSQQGDGPYGYFGGNIYLGSFYFENQIPVKPSAEVGYGEVYAGNINLVAGHIMDYYPGPQATGTGIYGGNTGTIRLTSLYAPNYEVRPHSTPTGIYFPPGVEYTTLAVTPQGVGIGTDEPSAALEINGEGFAAMRLYSDAGGNEWAFSANPAGNITFNQIGTGGQELTVRERFDAQGPTLDVQGSVRGTQFIASSSRELKTDFNTLDGKEVLNRLSEVPVMSWRYKTEDETTQHFGLVAEDFRAAFQLGDGRTISSIDADGVAMAAIQGLHELVQEQGSSLEQQQANLTKRDQEIAELRATVARLEETLQQLTADKQ